MFDLERSDVSGVDAGSLQHLLVRTSGELSVSAVAGGLEGDSLSDWLDCRDRMKRSTAVRDLVEDPRVLAASERLRLARLARREAVSLVVDAGGVVADSAAVRDADVLVSEARAALRVARRARDVSFSGGVDPLFESADWEEDELSASGFTTLDGFEPVDVDDGMAYLAEELPGHGGDLYAAQLVISASEAQCIDPDAMALEISEYPELAVEDHPDLFEHAWKLKGHLEARERRPFRRVDDGVERLCVTVVRPHASRAVRVTRFVEWVLGMFEEPGHELHCVVARERRRAVAEQRAWEGSWSFGALVERGRAAQRSVEWLEHLQREAQAARPGVPAPVRFRLGAARARLLRLRLLYSRRARFYGTSMPPVTVVSERDRLRWRPLRFVQTRAQMALVVAEDARVSSAIRQDGHVALARWLARSQGRKMGTMHRVTCARGLMARPQGTVSWESQPTVARDVLVYIDAVRASLNEPVTRSTHRFELIRRAAVCAGYSGASLYSLREVCRAAMAQGTRVESVEGGWAGAVPERTGFRRDPDGVHRRVVAELVAAQRAREAGPVGSVVAPRRRDAGVTSEYVAWCRRRALVARAEQLGLL